MRTIRIPEKARLQQEYNRDEQKAVSKSERNPDYVGQSVDVMYTSTRNNSQTVHDNVNSSDASNTDDTSIQSNNTGEHTSARNKCKTVEDTRNQVIYQVRMIHVFRARIWRTNISKEQVQNC